MKAKLEYDLPEDETEFNWARDGWKRWRQLSDIEDKVRMWRKHGCELTTDQLLDQLWNDWIPHDLDMDD